MLATLFDSLGGPTAMSRRLSLPFTTVASWKARGSIPVEQWPAIVDMAAAAGLPDITLDSYWRVHGLDGPPETSPEPAPTVERNDGAAFHPVTGEAA